MTMRLRQLDLFEREADVKVRIPLRTRSVANLRESWPDRAKRAKEERLIAGLKTREGMRGKVLLSPFSVSITRVSPRPLDGDNLGIAMKAIRDGVADALGLKTDWEGAEVSWRYGQARGGTREYAVEIGIWGACP